MPLLSVLSGTRCESVYLVLMFVSASAAALHGLFLVFLGSVFATASCDSTARVWRYVEGKWTSTVLEVPANEIK